MRGIVIGIGVVLLGAAAGFGQQTEPATGGELPAGVVAVVNGETITKQAAEDLIWDWYGPYLLSGMIDETLVFQEAAKRGITISDEEIKAEMIKQRGEGATDSSIEQELARQGRTMARAMRDTKLSMLLQRMVANSIEIAPQDLDAVRARQIVIRVASEDEEAKARELAIHTRERILAGEAFADVAKEISIDPAAKEKGGDMGIVRKGMVRPEIEAALFSLKVGEVSSPIRSGMGYSILLVEEKIPASSLSEEERTKLMEQRRSTLAAREMPKWFDQVKKQATITAVFKDLNSPAASGEDTGAE
jgi:parvulin-like peptidyl-prolyl isomerase